MQIATQRRNEDEDDHRKTANNDKTPARRTSQQYQSNSRLRIHSTDVDYLQKASKLHLDRRGQGLRQARMTPRRERARAYKTESPRKRVPHGGSGFRKGQIAELVNNYR